VRPRLREPEDASGCLSECSTDLAHCSLSEWDSVGYPISIEVVRPRPAGPNSSRGGPEGSQESTSPKATRRDNPRPAYGSVIRLGTGSRIDLNEGVLHCELR
jgi:hypothetical protein